MKKSALLILAAIFVIGIQSCSTDLQEEISPENLDPIEDSLQKNGTLTLPGCTKTLYIDYGNLDSYERKEFASLAKEKWFDNKVIVETTRCHSIEIWRVPCDDPNRFGSKKDEKDKVVDAEESLTLGEGGAPPPPDVTNTPRYKPESASVYNICITGIEDIIEDDDNVGDNPPAPTPDDDNPHNTPGLPVRNIR